MKVIMIGSHLNVPGGITRVVKNYMECGIKDKVELEYFPTYYGANLFKSIPYFWKQYLILLIKLFIKKERFDLAHIHMSYKGSFIRKKLIVKVLNHFNTRIILHMHGSQFKDFYNSSSSKKQQEIRETLDSVNCILALGHNWKEYYSTLTKTEIISLNNAVLPKVNKDYSEEKIYITSMGVLSQRKGTYDVIKVAKDLKGKIDSKYKFMLAGNGDIEKVKKQIKDVGLEDMFVIPGWISDEKQVENIYRKSIIYLLPSYNEGMPMSILEAMSYGLPIVSTDVGSIKDLVSNGGGYILTPGDVEGISNSISILLQDEHIRKEIFESNIKQINENFNLNKSVEDLLYIYKQLIKQ